MAKRLALALLTTGGLAALVAAEGPTVAPAPPVDQLVAQLGSPDFKARAAASRQLEGRGTDALPALRKALPHPDPEVRQRLTTLIASLERAALLAPKRVTVHMDQKPFGDVVAELARQTGYRLDTQGALRTMPVTLNVDNSPFWPAFDKVCTQAGVVAQQHHDGQPGLMLYPQNVIVPFVDYHGAFRMSANSFHYAKSLSFATLPRTGTGGGQRTESLSFNFQVIAEPKLPLLGLGPARVLAAVDDQDNILVPPMLRNTGYETFYNGMGGYRGFHMQSQVQLLGPAPSARSIRILRGSLPVTILAETKPEIEVPNILTVKNGKFEGHEVTLEIESAKEGPNKSYQVQVTARRTGKENPNDYTWTNSLHQRIELVDEKGNKYQSQGFNWNEGSPTTVRGNFMFADPGTNKELGKPAKLVYYGWVTMQYTVEFEFRDLPLP